MGRPTKNPYAKYLSAEASLLLAKAPDRYVRTNVIGFTGFMCRSGRSLASATQADLLAYGAELEGLDVPRPKQGVRDTAMAWNRMVTSVPGWPQVLLSPPSSTRASIPYTSLPAAFREDCDRYFASRTEASDEDLFSPTNKKPWAPATLKDRRGKICQLVSAYVETGGKLSDLNSLEDMFARNRHKKILVQIKHEHGGGKSSHSANLAHCLLIIAKHYCDVPEADIVEIRNAKNNLRPSKVGMTAKNRARLRTILEDQALHRLLKLPTIFMRKIDTTNPTLPDAIQVQSALAMDIERVAPMRAKNLAKLDMESHFDFVSETQCHIVIEGDDVKNDQTLNYVLGENFIKLYRTYVDVYRPLLLKDNKSTSLFISRTGRTKTPAELGVQVQKFIKAHTGLHMNIHLFRHLTGYVYLQNYPGQYEPVRQLLGHKDLRTTVSFYVGLEEDAAFKRYGEILDRLTSEEEGDDDA
jgi:site-specific recombinase XerD